MTATAWTPAPCGCCRIRVHTAPRGSRPRGAPRRPKRPRYAYLLESRGGLQPDFMSTYRYHQVGHALEAGLADAAAGHADDEDRSL